MKQEQQHDLSNFSCVAVKYYIVHWEPEVNKKEIVSLLMLSEVPVKFTCRQRTPVVRIGSIIALKSITQLRFCVMGS